MTINHMFVAQSWANLLDNKFRIGRFGFGLDPLLNFIPFAGPVVSLGLSVYIWWIAMMMDVPQHIHSKMLRNLILDFLLGLIPFIGTIGDFFFKANIKNIQMMQDWFEANPPKSS